MTPTAAANKENTSALAGAYLVNGTVGNTGMAGAPIMHFSLVVVPSTHSVSGTVEITQAIAPPNGKIVVKQVKGSIRATGYGKVTQVVALEGVYYQSATPPAIGTWQVPFSAHMAIDNSWNGQGGFSYGDNHIEDVPVKKQ